MDQAMNVNDWYLYQGVANVIVFHRVVAPRLIGSAPDEAAIAAAMPKALVTFRELSRLLGTQSYFAGDAISLADLMIAPQLDMFARAPEWATSDGGRAQSCRVARAGDRAPELRGDHMGAARGDCRGRLSLSRKPVLGRRARPREKRLQPAA